MSRDPKIRRKDLKSPDEFHTATQRALTFLGAHEREALMAVGALLALVALVLAVRGYRSWRDGQAEAAFRDAFRAYAAEDLTKAREGFQKVSESWFGTWGDLALVYLGDSAMRTKDAAAAKVAFEKALESSGEPSVRQIAEYNLGVIKRNSGDAAGASEHFRRAASADGPLRSAALVALAATGGEGPPLVEARAEAEELLPPDLREFVAARAPAKAE